MQPERQLLARQRLDDSVRRQTTALAIGGSNNVVRAGRHALESRLGLHHLLEHAVEQFAFELRFVCRTSTLANRGENADGFAIKFRNLGPGNVVVAARAWDNSDDGFDLWDSRERIVRPQFLVISQWHYVLCSTIRLGFRAMATAFKLGHDSGHTSWPEHARVGQSRHNGIDVNGNATTTLETRRTIRFAHGVQIYNVTASNNGSGTSSSMKTQPPPRRLRAMCCETTSRTRAARPSIRETLRTIILSLDLMDHQLDWAFRPLTLSRRSIRLFTAGSYHPAGSGGDRSGITIPVHATGPAVGAIG